MAKDRWSAFVSSALMAACAAGALAAAFVQNLAPSTMSVPQFRADKKCDFFDPQLKY